MEKPRMTYTIETVRTVAGRRYYIRHRGKLICAGFASKTSARERIKFLEVMEQAQRDLNEQIRAVRQERTA